MDTLHTNRRSFLRTVGAAGLAVGAAGLAGCGDSDHSAVRFDHGVASGDPLTDRVILWTRVSGVEGPVELEWIVARDAALREVVASGLAATSADTDYTVHVDAVGLHAGTTYHYGFRALGSESPVGRTRTLPGGQVERVRLAAVSCSNFPAGFFHVYREIAQRNDLDALLHLGDYIYNTHAANTHPPTLPRWAARCCRHTSCSPSTTIASATRNTAATPTCKPSTPHCR